MTVRTDESLIYVNYSPYENAGSILDYLLDHYRDVFVFTFGFHSLQNKKNLHTLRHFQNSRLVSEIKLPQIPVSKKLNFALLPIRSLVTLIQILIYSIKIKKELKKDIDIYFTVNAFTAWIGNLLRGLKVVKKTMFWVWDYYPPNHPSLTTKLMRSIYWQFDKSATYSDRVCFVNQRLIDLRKKNNLLPHSSSYPIVPIGTQKKYLTGKLRYQSARFCFLGVLKKSQGLEIFFDNAKKILTSFPGAKLDVIGSGPDELYFKSCAKKITLPVTFHGYLEDKQRDSVISRCAIGLATYVPGVADVSHYGDPAKIKSYLSLGVPVIITDVFESSREIVKNSAGIIIDTSDPLAFTSATKKIMSNHSRFSKNALKLSKKYYYKNIYPKLFTF